MLIRHVRLVPVGGYAVPNDPVDVRVDENQILSVGPSLPPWRGEDVVDAQGRWAIPGLWDQHVHMQQWSLTKVRLDTASATCPEDVTKVVREHIDSLEEPDPQRIVVGFGHRMGSWSRPPTTEELDDVSGDIPVILISGDAHNGWLNSSAQRRLAVPYNPGPLEENDWFPIFSEMSRFPQLVKQHARAYDLAVEDAHAKGVVGIVDFEFEMGYAEWARRYYNGLRSLRVRTAIYEDSLDGVIAANLQTGDELVGTDRMIHMGPLKIISDGSLNTRTAYCCDPYAGDIALAHPHGRPNQPYIDLLTTMRRAKDFNLTLAIHAIGDQAVSDALESFEVSGAPGTIEHAQLMRFEDVTRMASLGIAASVQPAHLIDDRDVSALAWPDRMDRCFLFGSLARAGVPLLLGSDAPVSPLDPWVAMAAAVHRSGDDRAPWNPGESIDASTALASSTDRCTTIQLGNRPDVVLLDHNPLEEKSSTLEVAEHLKSVHVAATIVAGECVWHDGIVFG